MINMLTTQNLILSVPNQDDLSAIKDFEDRNRNHLRKWESTKSTNNQPVHEEIQKRLGDWIKEFLKNRYGLFATPSKVVGELNDLDIGDTNDVWQLIRELLEEISPKDYKGSRPHKSLMRKQ